MPLTHFGKFLVFLRPYPTTKSIPGKVKNLFPCYPITMPSTFEERSHDLFFRETHARVFRSAPLTKSKEYIAWLNKVQDKRQK